MAQRTLRTVADNERTPAKPKTLAEAVESGDYLEILKAQRRDIAASLPACGDRAKAALHRQLMLLSKEIEQIETASSDESVVADSADERFDESAL